MLDVLARDVIYGLRIARRNPGFTATVVLTLGLGIGVTTTTFTVADAVIFRPLPYAQPDRLVKVWGRSSAYPTDNMALADFTGVNALTAIFVTATDLATHLAVFVVLGTAGLLASYLPARRAAVVDPMIALQE